MRKTIITGVADYRNKGDAAILEGTINALTRSGIPISRVFSPNSLFWKNHMVNGLDIEHIPSLDSSKRSIRINAAFNIRSNLVPAATFIMAKPGFETLSHFSKSNIIDALSSADNIWLIGGSFVVHDNRFIPQMLHVLYLKRRWKNRKTVIMGGHSIGPFYSRASRFFASEFLSKHVDILLLREKYSLEYIIHELKTRLPTTRIMSDFSIHTNPQTTNSVKAIFGNIDDMRKKAPNSHVVGLSARPWFYQIWAKNRVNRNATYLGFLANFVKKLCQEGYYVAFYPSSTVPGSEDDRVIYNSISKLLKIKNAGCGERFSLIEMDRLSGSEAYAVPSKLDAMVAVRTHAAIAAMKSLIPTIHIYYHYKGKGIFEHLHTPVDCINLEELLSMTVTPSELVKMVERKIKNHDEIREQTRTSIENRISEDEGTLQETLRQT